MVEDSVQYLGRNIGLVELDDLVGINIEALPVDDQILGDLIDLGGGLVGNRNIAFATATKNDPLSNTDVTEQNRWINYKSIGLGLRFNIPGSINTRLMYANKIGVDQPNDNRYGRLMADFTYSF